MPAPIYFTRNGIAKACHERDYRTWLNKNNHPAPDAFLRHGRRLIPLFRVATPEEQSQIAKEH